VDGAPHAELGRVFVQAESELGAINMALGAAATGARVMVSSSSPGISLMAEAMSYMAGSGTPMVLVNIMRAGPGWAASARRRATTSRPPRATATAITACRSWRRPRSARPWS
jgi:pyruvate/2-oxoacid:ferredoxin oxidoreductase alpha subunit